ncbi:DUF2214 family protein [Phenylobacterium sp.]|uniref:DUF2214 family protein n=1 Tax=Phenylobacterium sp. TaxID=1871053 RepID=UPI0027323682|nr:DUF2214 family protein [Phenylobacterium sp.]MDP3852986.1 DUF2214 family protein [Phenylobacterium sp.]
MTDLVLAIAHHLLVFALFAILAVELVMIRPGLAGNDLKRLGIVDLHYGLIAGLILAAGFARVFLGLKGPDAYLGNWVFWAKIAAFLVVGVLSVQPTIRIAVWRRQAKDDPAFALTPDHVASVRGFLIAELAVFALIPAFAAAMARGYGL